MSLVVKPSARERFTPRELIAAYEDFIKSEPQYLDAETGHKATAYLFGAGVLLVYEEPETHVVILIHPSAWKVNSAKFALRWFSESSIDWLSQAICLAEPARRSAGGFKVPDAG
jgi:hypothetical protein